MFWFLKKGASHALAVQEAEDHAGDRITAIGTRRRAVVRRVVGRAVDEHWSVRRLANALKRQASSSRDQDRDWQRVARTEVTNATGRGSIELLRGLYGEDVLVTRGTHDCCDTCAAHFGRGRRRVLRLGDIPERLYGAVHPNCVCSEWELHTKPLRKAESLGMGIVKRDLAGGPDGEFSLSTGTGYWVPLDSLTGQAILRQILVRTPFVLIERRPDGYVVLRHGHGQPKVGNLELFDPRLVMGAGFYSLDPFNAPEGRSRERLMALRRDWDSYVSVLLKTLPSVAQMPEYWENKGGLKHVTDFMGFKTLTDWYVLLPSEPKVESRIFKKRLGIDSVRSAVRRTTRRLMGEEDLLKQITYHFHNNTAPKPDEPQPVKFREVQPTATPKNRFMDATVRHTKVGDIRMIGDKKYRKTAARIWEPHEEETPKAATAKQGKPHAVPTVSKASEFANEHLGTRADSWWQLDDDDLLG